jgi:hypothetical protein
VPLVGVEVVLVEKGIFEGDSLVLEMVDGVVWRAMNWSVPARRAAAWRSQ